MAAPQETTVRPVGGKADLKRFIDFPYRLYRKHPYWVPPLRMSEWERFDPRKNPFYRHGRIDLFLAEREGRVVGRVGAIDNDNHRLEHQDNLAFFGFFEAEDAAAAAALFRAVETWAQGLGRSGLRGPVNPTMDDGAGFQLDAFATSPFVLMTYSPPEYLTYAEAAGYRKAKDLYAWLVEEERGLGERLLRLVDRVQERYQPVIRTADMKHYRRELGLLKHIYNEAWERNWGFVKVTDAEMDKLASDLKLILDPEVVVFAEIGGEVAGLAVGLPDIHQVFKRMPDGRLLPFGLVPLLRRKQIIDQIRLPILGVLPKYRNKGLELLMIREVYRRGTAKGYRRCECSWILEDNDAMNNGIRAAGGELYKRYRLFQKDL